MNPRKIATTLLLVSLLGTGLASCNKSAEVTKEPQAQTTTANAASPSPERAQRRLAMQTKIKAILTPPQVQQLDTKLNAGEKMREAMKAIDLTADQKAKIKEVYQAARAEREKSSGENAQ